MVTEDVTISVFLPISNEYCAWPTGGQPKAGAPLRSASGVGMSRVVMPAEYPRMERSLTPALGGERYSALHGSCLQVTVDTSLHLLES